MNGARRRRRGRAGLAARARGHGVTGDRTAAVRSWSGPANGGRVGAGGGRHVGRCARRGRSHATRNNCVRLNRGRTSAGRIGCGHNERVVVAVCQTGDHALQRASIGRRAGLPTVSGGRVVDRGDGVRGNWRGTSQVWSGEAHGCLTRRRNCHRRNWCVVGIETVRRGVGQRPRKDRQAIGSKTKGECRITSRVRNRG